MFSARVNATTILLLEQISPLSFSMYVRARVRACL